MRFLAFGLIALAAAGIVSQASAQSFEIGPGGARVYQERPRAYEERSYGDEVRGMRRRGGMCAELRDACFNSDRYGEEGQGNCRRYRRTCE